MVRLSTPLAGFLLVALIAASPQASVEERRKKLREIFDSLRTIGSEGITCPEECDVGLRPVCGSNNVVYLNDCSLRQASCSDSSITKLHDGPCVSGQSAGGGGSSKCREDCQRIYTPVCGTNGRTYNNRCILQAASCNSVSNGNGAIRIARDGPCDVPEKCKRDCSDFYSPLCGTNGVTYGNQCWYNVAKCLDSNIERLSTGECGGRVATVSASSQKCSEECTRIYLPVCGTNGKTYNNKCILEASSCQHSKEGKGAIAVAHDGPCDIPASCRKDCASTYQPKCGSNGVTYGNTCWLSVAQCLNPDITENHEGECRQDSAIRCVERCNKIYIPVCGTNGQTYNNKCIMEVANCRSVRDGKGSVRVAHEGLCERDRGCHRNCSISYQPVCATNGITYDNGCLFAIAKCLNNQLNVDYQGVCAEADFAAVTTAEWPPTPLGQSAAVVSGPYCPDVCSLGFQPVCGSDGLVYGSECKLNVARCRNLALTKRNEGVCSKDCSIQCYRDDEPVCGSDGVTYENDCFLVSARCKDSSITRLYYGHCVATEDPVCASPCTDPDAPVCGSDGRTYRNRCMLNKNACIHKGLIILYKGSCQQDSVECDHISCEDNERRLVCGDDGVTYRNHCELIVRACTSRTSIIKAADGPCL